MESSPELFESVSKDPSVDPEVRVIADETLPGLRAHLADAQALESKLSK